MKHSGIGIASFVISVVSGLFLFITFVVAGLLEASAPGRLDEDSLEAVFVGLSCLTFMATSLVALGLGIGGLCQQHRNKLFAVLGVVIASAGIVGTLFLVLLGLAMS